MNNIMIDGEIYNLDHFDKYTFYDQVLYLWLANSDNRYTVRGPEAFAAWEWLQKTCMWRYEAPAKPSYGDYAQAQGRLNRGYSETITAKTLGFEGEEI